MCRESGGFLKIHMSWQNDDKTIGIQNTFCHIGISLLPVLFVQSLEAIKDTVDSVGIEGLPFVTLDGYEITPTIFWAKVELEN